jgi:hypothetical protein
MDGTEFVDVFELGQTFNEEKVSETPAASTEDVVEVPVEVVEEPTEKVEEVVDEAPVEDAVEEPTETLTEDESYYEDLMQSYLDEGVFDIEGDEVEAEFTQEGFKEMVNKTVEKKQKEAINTYKESLGEKGQALLEIIEKGGEVDDFLNMEEEIDFSKVPLEQNGKGIIKNQQALIEDWLSISGYTDDEIDETVNDYLEAGDKMLRKQAELAQRKLTAWQKDKNESLIAEKEKVKIEQQQQQTQAAEEFRDKVVNTNEISGFKVSKQKAAQLYDFITKPDKEGKTGFQKADTVDNQLLYAYFAMEGFNKEKLSREIATKQTRTIKKKLSQYTDTNTSPKRSTQQSRRTDSSLDIPWNM